MKNVPGKQMSEAFWSCNINRRGRVVRLLTSLVFFAAAAWFWWSRENAFLASGLLAFGLVGLFEALRGWCLLRAFGLNTPL